MADLNPSSKRVQIDKANKSMVLFVCIAVAVSVTSLMMGRGVIAKSRYQSKVISAQQDALKLSEANIKAVDELVASYTVFNGQPINVIGGGSSSKGGNNGDNSKIVLDALPSQYDFPALISSLEKILKDRNFKVDNISGTDAATDNPEASSTAQVAEIPFQFSVKGSPAATEDLVKVFERTVRPIAFNTMSLNASDASLTLEVSAKTYYQPGIGLKVTTKDVK